MGLPVKRPPCIEYELDDNGVCTGRTRKRQFISYPRPHDRKPIIPWGFS